MMHDEGKQEAPDAAEVARTISRQAEQQPADKADRAKADEGTRPGDLTSENDGGVEG